MKTLRTTLLAVPLHARVVNDPQPMKTTNPRWLATAFCLVLCMRSLLPAVTFTVTNNTANSGSGTLRQAILDANTNSDLDRIEFDLAGGSAVKTITPSTALPAILFPVIIDGTTQPGYAGVTPVIELNGTNAAAAIGLELRGGNSTIRALTINRFHFPGIVIQTNGNNVIEACFIGTDASGTNARGNGIASVSDGIAIINSSGNLIGGTSPFAGNVISGNGRYGIGLIGSLSQSNRIEANLIGTDLNGMIAKPNRDGIGILDAPGNTIGGPNIFFLNIISGNTEQGIAIVGAHAVGNSVERNYIGLDASGLAPLPNGQNGILISTTSLPAFPGPASANRIGGNGTGNAISGNGRDGIQMGFGTTSNQVTGNLIGLNENGSGLVPNGRHGVSIFDSTNNSIIGVESAFNRIAGNNSNGVFIGRGALNVGSVSNRIENNLIATNGLDGIQLSGGANGNRILGNIIGGVFFSDGTPILGNGRHGVAVFDSTNNVIGERSSDLTWNNISGNRSNGVFLGKGALDAGSSSNIVRGNQIGNNTMGNGGAGIFVQGSGNMIGGFGLRDGNKIGFNGTNLRQRGHGVVIESGTNNAILGNSFLANAGRAIDLGNDSFTVNDLGDADTGANDLQNYPVVAGVRFDSLAGTHDITWTLNSKPNRAYYIQFFANSAPDASGFGEGERFLNFRGVVTDDKGFAVFTNQFAEAEEFISATATDLTDLNTSEFSPVDTDGDALADAWEAVSGGIDYDENGTNDLTFPSANWRHKDIYVEIDAMLGRAPDMDNLGRAQSGSVHPRTGRFNEDGFVSAPGPLVQNPDGEDGILVHLELDETNLTFAVWPTIATNRFYLFDVLKTNHFGTVRQQTNAAALAAKRLVHHYCIYVDTVPDEWGRARDIPANDFYIAMGALATSPVSDHVPTTFMHELGHCLNLHHGGVDGENFKPNYHSIMNYAWDGSVGGNAPWKLDFSREAFPPLNEADLNEEAGIGASNAHEFHSVKVGPHRIGTNKVAIIRALETGPVDWNTNGAASDPHVARDLNYLSGTDPSPGSNLVSCVDWTRIHYYFLDARTTGSVFMVDDQTNDLAPSVLEAFEKLGTGVGQLQFSLANYSVSETGSVAVISVTRIFEAEGNVSVSFSTVNGTATNGLDFVATNGVLSFTGSESIKTFVVPVLNDGTAEAPETIRLVLVNATGGATLGVSDQATLTIVDDDPPVHFTVINTNDSGAGSLRQAILDANSATGLAIIDFNIPITNGLTISPASALPTLTRPVTIDGTTQPGFASAPLIELNGTSAGAGSDGLQISAGNSTVRGLIINRFGGNGIKLSISGGNRIEGCYLGLNRPGTLDQGNGSGGVFIDSANNVIGGSMAAARNFISGNNASGVIIGGVSATNNLVLGNVIGLGVDGSDQGNSIAGVNISSPRNTVGGTAAGARNVISGNDQDGIFIGGGIASRVMGNYIGTDLAGTVARGNGGNGIKVSAADGHVIGGNQGGAGNVISGNGLFGIELATASGVVVQGNRIGTDVTGGSALPNQGGGIVLQSLAQGNQIGDTTGFGANTIAFNSGPGVFIASTSAVNNTIRGNSIFSNAGASLGIDLSPQGTSLNDTNDTDSGANQLQNFPLLTSATNSPTGTLVSGSLNSRPNTNFTIDFYASVAPDPSSFGEGQSWIGSMNVTTDGSGNAAFTAASPAIYLIGRHITATTTDAAGNTSEFSPAIFAASSIPGRTFTVENVNDSGEGSLRQAILDANAYRSSEQDTIEFSIPGFGVQTIRPLSPLPVIDDPVLIDGYSQPGASPNTALTGHNGVLLIELDGSLAGITYGLRIRGGDSLVRGLVINRFGVGAGALDPAGGLEVSVGTGNRIEGNLIGTDANGTNALPNLPNGVFIVSGCTGNMVGGTNAARANLICGGLVGVMIHGQSNVVQGNFIGTQMDGDSPLTNAGDGIVIQESFNQIGGVGPGTGNTIAFSAGSGVLISAGTNNAVLGNSIFSNTGLGIDLGTAGVTSNDSGDADSGANNLQNFPVLSSAKNTGSATLIAGTLNSRGSMLYRIEFFANTNCHPTGHGQGRTFLNSTTAITDASGNALISFNHPVPIPVGQIITATATDPNNNTSEFSPCVTVINDTVVPPFVTFTTPTPTTGDAFGFSVAALDRGRVLIGSSKTDWSPDAAYLFSISGTLLAAFTNVPATFTNGNGLPYGGGFGRAVAPLGNNLVLIGADRAGPSLTGAVYLFNTNGALLMTFANPNPSPSALDYFGMSVAGVGSDRVLIGAEEEDTGALDTGVAYLFNTNGTLLNTFTNPTPENDDLFGDTVAVVGNDWLLIGAYADRTGAFEAGSVYLFSTNGTLLTTITNPTPQFQDFFSFFGAAAAVGNDRVLIGAYRDNTGAADAGAAHLFSTNGTLLMTFTNPTPAFEDQFGNAVAAVGNDRVLISAFRDDTGATDAGAVYLFSTNGALLMTITNPTPAIGDLFGFSVAAVGNEWALIGAIRDDTAGTDAGAAYLFNIAPSVTPSLTIRLTDTNTVVISWPSPSAGFVLQQNTDLNTTNWVGPTEALNDDGTSKFIIVNPTTGNRYYRLLKL